MAPPTTTPPPDGESRYYRALTGRRYGPPPTSGPVVSVLTYPLYDISGDYVVPDGGDWSSRFPVRQDYGVSNWAHGIPVGVGRVEHKAIDHPERPGETVTVAVGYTDFFHKASDLDGVDLTEYKSPGDRRPVGRYTVSDVLRAAADAEELVRNDVATGVSIEFEPRGRKGMPEEPGAAYWDLEGWSHLDNRPPRFFKDWYGLAYAHARMPVNQGCRTVTSKSLPEGHPSRTPQGYPDLPDYQDRAIVIAETGRLPGGRPLDGRILKAFREAGGVDLLPPRRPSVRVEGVVPVEVKATYPHDPEVLEKLLADKGLQKAGFNLKVLQSLHPDDIAALSRQAAEGGHADIGGPHAYELVDEDAEGAGEKATPSRRTDVTDFSGARNSASRLSRWAYDATATVPGGEHTRHSQDALDHAEEGNSAYAARAHRRAASIHRTAMEKVPEGSEEYFGHEAAADLHRRAAALHEVEDTSTNRGHEIPSRIHAKAGSDEWISEKIKKIMREGVRGKKVSQKQAVAIAYSMAGRASKAIDPSNYSFTQLFNDRKHTGSRGHVYKTHAETGYQEQGREYHLSDKLLGKMQEHAKSLPAASDYTVHLIRGRTAEGKDTGEHYFVVAKHSRKDKSVTSHAVLTHDEMKTLAARENKNRDKSRGFVSRALGNFAKVLESRPDITVKALPEDWADGGDIHPEYVAGLTPDCQPEDVYVKADDEGDDSAFEAAYSASERAHGLTRASRTDRALPFSSDALRSGGTRDHTTSAIHHGNAAYYHERAGDTEAASAHREAERLHRTAAASYRPSGAKSVDTSMPSDRAVNRIKQGFNRTLTAGAASLSQRAALASKASGHDTAFRKAGSANAMAEHASTAQDTANLHHFHTQAANLHMEAVGHHEGAGHDGPAEAHRSAAEAHYRAATHYGSMLGGAKSMSPRPGGSVPLHHLADSITQGLAKQTVPPGHVAQSQHASNLSRLASFAKGGMEAHSLHLAAADAHDKAASNFSSDHKYGRQHSDLAAAHREAAFSIDHPELRGAKSIPDYSTPGQDPDAPPVGVRILLNMAQYKMDGCEAAIRDLQASDNVELRRFVMTKCAEWEREAGEFQARAQALDATLKGASAVAPLGPDGVVLDTGGVVGADGTQTKSVPEAAPWWSREFKAEDAELKVERDELGGIVCKAYPEWEPRRFPQSALRDVGPVRKSKPIAPKAPPPEPDPEVERVLRAVADEAKRTKEILDAVEARKRNGVQI